MKSTLRIAINVAAVMALLVALPRTAYAAGQEVGRIVGKVFEEQTGAPVPGAQITVTGTNLIGPPRTTQTADDGTFEVPNLPQGPYDVEVSYSGVKPIKRKILVRPSEAAPLEIAWSAELAAVETTVVQEERHLTKPDTAIAGATFSMEKQNLLPVPRQYQSVVTQAPGVNENGSGNPRVKGGNDRNNRVLIDGLDTTDPVTNTFSANIGQDSLAAVQVITGGFEAKYNALGSIINLITNSGSDELHFIVSFYTRPKQLQTFQTSGSAGATYEGARIFDTTPQPPANVFQGNFTIGGPIIKHQLWYSFGAQLDYSTTVQPSGPPLNKQAPLRVFQDIFPQGKLTWAPSSQHRLMIEALADPTYIDYENNNGTSANNTEPIAALGRFQGGYKILGEWDYFINQNIDWKLLGGYSYSTIDDGPQGKVRSIDSKYGTYPGFAASQHVNLADLTFWRNGQVEQDTKRNRFQLDGALTWRGRTGEVSHEAEAGFQTAYTWHNLQFSPTGGGDQYQDFMAGVPLDGALCDADPTLPNYDPNNITGRGCNTIVHFDTYSTLQRGYKIGLYAQDRLKPTSWLTLIPGLRWDINRVWAPNGVPDDWKRTVIINGRQVTTDDYQLASGFGPRLTAIVDLTGDQKTIFQANYGRSTEELYLTTISGVEQSIKGNSRTLQWDPVAKRFNTLTAVNNQNLVDSSGRTLPHQDELFFRLSRELFRNTVGEIDYTYRYYSNLLEQVEVNRIWDPSGSRTAGWVDPNRQYEVRVYTNDDRNWQKYSGFDFIFESRPTPNFDFFGSYTLSWTWGPGYQENNGGLGQFYNPRQAQFFAAWNPNSDVRHIIKTQTTYTVHGLVIGATVNWRSGFALAKQFPVNSSITTGNSRFRTPFGTDPSAVNDIHQWTEFRLPDQFVVNMLFGYDFYELTRQHFLLTVQFENLLNQYTPTALQTIETAPPTRFGQVTARPVPFRTQLGIKYSY
jgi:outer membrane receptor protein involved in Fe transport